MKNSIKFCLCFLPTTFDIQDEASIFKRLMNDGRYIIYEVNMSDFEQW